MNQHEVKKIWQRALAAMASVVVSLTCMFGTMMGFIEASCGA